MLQNIILISQKKFHFHQKNYINLSPPTPKATIPMDQVVKMTLGNKRSLFSKSA